MHTYITHAPDASIIPGVGLMEELAEDEGLEITKLLPETGPLNVGVS